MSFLRLIQRLGPGLLFAGAAIGVSHLVQSTRAGAEFGMQLIWAMVLVNLLKYPFFEFGPRFSSATGLDLVEGYNKLGKWVLGLFTLVTLLTVFTIQAAVTVVTGGIAQYLMPIGLGVPGWSAIILAVCLIILLVGKYAVLDKFIKWVVVALSISTLIALIAAFRIPAPDPFIEKAFTWSNDLHLVFLIALMGWMPAPIDLSVWHSIWALEKRKLDDEFSFAPAMFDFRVGYSGAALLALVFLGLGSMVMYGSGKELPAGGAAFAGELIGLYTNSLGYWAKWIISLAAFSTMFSTTITCLDAIPRVLDRIRASFRDEPQHLTNIKYYWVFIVLLSIGAVMLISVFNNKMLSLIQLATVLSFLTAPFFAIANYILVTGKHMPEAHKPGTILRILSWMGMVFLLGFTILYVYSEYF